MGDGAKRLGEHIGVSEEQERLVAARQKCHENYVAPERDLVKSKGQKKGFAEGREEALRLDEMGIQVPTQSVSKEKPKTHSLDEGLSGIKDKLSRREETSVEKRPIPKSGGPSAREL